MKRTAIIANFSKISRSAHGIRVFMRTFVTLSLLTLGFFILFSVVGYVQSKLSNSSVTSMKGLAASVSSRFFTDMIGMEVPQLASNQSDSTFSRKNVAEFVFQFLTNINPADPKSLLAREVPGLGEERAVILRKGMATDLNVYPVDSTPPVDVLIPDDPAHNGPESEGTDTIEGMNVQKPAQSDAQSPGSDTAEGSDGQKPASNDGTGKEEAASTSKPPADRPVLSTRGKKAVFIYHSHNRESWIPELKNKGADSPDEAYDAKVNITLLGTRLKTKLGDLGLGAMNSATDYPSAIKNFNYNFSYKYSLKTVQEAFAVDPDLVYYFDIHRDSLEREHTTVKIDGKNYAQVYFIIGQKNPHWEQNEAFAKKIHERLEKDYPGLSRGTWNKSSHTGNAEYNQSFSVNSVLIEVGGPENTLEESYRAIDILAKAIADVYWEAERVDAPVKTTAK